jgi:FtsZ-interacting cell division protein ZipA
MRADVQQPEQSPSHFLWTSVKHESKYVMSQKVARSPKANSPYESRAETEAAVERIHERFKDIRAAIAKEKAQKTSAAADSHPRPRQSALEREALQQSLGALTEARNSLNAACKIVCTSIDTVKRAVAAERLRDG